MSIASDLLKIKAFIFSPDDLFTWASGIKSPVYCDNRITLSYPEVRNKVIKGFAELIKKNYPDVEVIAGVATAGIPHGALVAQELGLPMIYVRASAKKHGKKNRIEGYLKPGSKVVVIEDLISTGMSAIDAVDAIEGAEILGVCAIFSYGLKASTKNFADRKLSFSTILNFDDLTETALEEGVLKKSQVKEILKWRDSL